MKTYDVIVERNNGHFRALFPALPNIAAEGATRDEAIAAATAAAQRYLREVEITTVHLAEPQPIANEVLKQEAPSHRPTIEREFALAAEANSPDAEARLGSLQSVLRAAADCRIDTTSELFKEYEEEMDERHQRAKVEAQWSFVEEQYPLAAAWMRSAGLSPQDPDDPSYQEYLAILAAQKQQQREEAAREAELADGLELTQSAR